MPHKLPYWMGTKYTHDPIYASYQYLSMLVSLYQSLKNERLLITIALDELEHSDEESVLLDKLDLLIRKFGQEFDAIDEVLDYCLDELAEILKYPPLPESKMIQDQ